MLPLLESLWLDDNRLEGTLPEFSQTFTALYVLYFLFKDNTNDVGIEKLVIIILLVHSQVQLNLLDNCKLESKIHYISFLMIV